MLVFKQHSVRDSATVLALACATFTHGTIQLRRRRHRAATLVRRQVAATVDRPPPPADLDEGDGEEEYEVRYLTNEEREYHANMWLPMAEPADREIIEARVLRFRSSVGFAGKSRMCVGAFLNKKCVGMITVEVVPDNSNLVTFMLQSKLLRCLAITTKPRVGNDAGSVLLTTIKELADQQSFKMDFEQLKNIAGGRYYVFARTL